VHIASLSSYSVVYKVRGSIETLYQYYPELRNPDYTTAITLGHARYSTNTSTAFERVQPFSLLGHNGEINTIARLREQAEMIGVQRVVGGSDSQDLDRAIASLIHVYGFTLTEAFELVFPPILSEIDKLPPELQTVSLTAGPSRMPRSGSRFRFGESACSARMPFSCVLWLGDTERIYLPPEKGVYHPDT
jgi:glutamate synthase (NADPH/NADH) large chain